MSSQPNERAVAGAPDADVHVLREDDNAFSARQSTVNPQLFPAASFLGMQDTRSNYPTSGTMGALFLRQQQRAGLTGFASHPQFGAGQLQLGGAGRVGGMGAGPSQLYNSPQVRPQAFAGNSTVEAQLREAEANLRDTNMRLLLLQQQRQQQNNQQQHGLRVVQNVQNMTANDALYSLYGPPGPNLEHNFSRNTQHQPATAATIVEAQMNALRGLGPLAGAGGPISPPQDLQVRGSNPFGSSPLTSALHLQQQQQQIQSASLRQALPAMAARIDNPQPAVQLSNAQPQRPSAGGDQEEMKDAEYFDLFGFNDQDGVQVINETFPHKLYRMLFEVERDGQQDIVSFFPHGKAFIVHQAKRFVEEIMPKYFSTTRMSSFQRQLNLYGFQRIDDGPEKGGFVHQFFQKGHRSLCNRIRRQRGRNQGGGQLPLVLPTAGAGSGSSQSLMGGNAFPGGQGADSAAAAQGSMPQNQQAQAVLRYLLTQQASADEEPRDGQEAKEDGT